MDLGLFLILLALALALSVIAYYVGLGDGRSNKFAFGALKFKQGLEKAGEIEAERVLTKHLRLAPVGGPVIVKETMPEPELGPEHAPRDVYEHEFESYNSNLPNELVKSTVDEHKPAKKKAKAKKKK